MSLLHDTDQQ